MCSRRIKDGGCVPAPDLMPLQQLPTKFQLDKERHATCYQCRRGDKKHVFYIVFFFGGSHLGCFVCDQDLG